MPSNKTTSFERIDIICSPPALGAYLIALLEADGWVADKGESTRHLWGQGMTKHTTLTLWREIPLGADNGSD